MTHEPANKPGKSGGDKDEVAEPVRYTVLSHRAIAAWAVLIVAAGVGMAVWLLLAYGNDGDARVQLDAIRTAGTVVVGAGGAAVLLLAARRQRSTEIALKQKDRDQADVARAHALQERMAAATEHDAAQRRVTELYTAAAAQLGSDKAPVRLAGLYALERLAQDNPAQRQTIVNVLCAYLRMPYTLPGVPPAADALDHVHTGYRERVQEREVRLTAQRLLETHLQPGPQQPVPTFWTDIDLDLTDAHLIDFSLSDCTLRTAAFPGAAFTGATYFNSATFTESAFFSSTTFTHSVSFSLAEFGRVAAFAGATFTSFVSFASATFTAAADFSSATFSRAADFDSATFRHIASFASATFTEDAEFDSAAFARRVPPEVERFWSPREESAAGNTGTDPAVEPDGRSG